MDSNCISGITWVENMNSRELIEMADTEWKNREKRKGIHDRISWTSGWISGYLSRKQKVGEQE